VTKQGVLVVILLALLSLFFCGCGAVSEPIPPKYVARETENGVYVFEYNPGNTATHEPDRLMLFMEALNAFHKAYPDLSVVHMEPIATRVSYRTDNGTRVVSVVHVLVYTQPKVK